MLRSTVPWLIRPAATPKGRQLAAPKPVPRQQPQVGHDYGKGDHTVVLEVDPERDRHAMFSTKSLLARHRSGASQLSQQCRKVDADGRPVFRHRRRPKSRALRQELVHERGKNDPADRPRVHCVTVERAIVLHCQKLSRFRADGTGASDRRTYQRHRHSPHATPPHALASWHAASPRVPHPSPRAHARRLSPHPRGL